MFKTFLIAVALMVSGVTYANMFTYIYLPDGTVMVCARIGQFLDCRIQ